MKKKILLSFAILAGVFIAVAAIRLQFPSDKEQGFGGAAALFERLPPSTAECAEIMDVPVKGMVTLLDLGSVSCIPCKMMAPIIEKLKKQYEGKAAVVFIDVWKDTKAGKRYGVRAIPTQIFFDKGGREVYRHVGFLGEEAIVRQLQKMGVS